MKIGFIGAGSVAQTLGAAFAAAGHDVRISSRNPQSEVLKTWLLTAGPRAAVGTFTEAAAFGELLIPAVQPWTILQPLLESIGTSTFRGKTMIDLGNAVDWTVRPPRLALPDGSLGEQMQAWLPESYVVKTLNMIAASRMAHPHYEDGIPTLLMAGNEITAKEQVTRLLREIGWTDILDVGDIRQSRQLESFMLTCLLAQFASKSCNAAFALLRQ